MGAGATRTVALTATGACCKLPPKPLAAGPIAPPAPGASVARPSSEELKQRILTAMMAAEPEPEAMIRSSLGAYFHFMGDDPRIARILLIEVFSVSQQTESLARHFMDELSDLFKALLETRYPRLLRQGLSPRLLTTGLVGATHHIALRWIMSDYAEPLEQVVETALQICRNALNLSSPPAS